MGERANVVVLDHRDSTGVVLYSHWGGYDHLKGALDVLSQPVAQDRWNDGPYLARIIFQSILDAHGPVESTGFGISAGLCDNNYPILVLDPETQRFDLRGEDLDLLFTRVELDEGWAFGEAPSVAVRLGEDL